MRRKYKFKNNRGLKIIKNKTPSPPPPPTKKKPKKKKKILMNRNELYVHPLKTRKRWFFLETHIQCSSRLFFHVIYQEKQNVEFGTACQSYVYQSSKFILQIS